MSLAQRLALVMAVVLAVLGTVAGMGVYHAVRRAREADLQQRNQARLAWLETSVERRGQTLRLDPRAAPQGAADYWEVAAPDGRALWASSETARRSSLTTSCVLDLGTPGAQALPGTAYVQCEPAADPQVPESSTATALPVYRFPAGPAGVKLKLTAHVATHEMSEELERLARVLWTFGVLALVVVGVSLALLVRWQLAPLAAMAREASAIGPGSATSIRSAGGVREYVRLRQALNLMLERMTAALERERSFAAMAAHELRSPLAQLRTGLELALRRERQPDEYRSAVREALADVARLEGLVGGLLQLTRVERGVVLPAGGASLKEVLRQAVGASGATAPVGDLPNAEIRVEGDAKLLATAVQNVLANAARYAPEGGCEWRCLLEGETVRVAIADSGPGVGENDRERIFEPLTRLEQARTIGAAPEGFGLGLAVARAAARAYGGDLSCQARTDGKRGAEFVFVFRRAAASSGGAKEEQAVAPAESGGSA